MTPKKYSVFGLSEGPEPEEKKKKKTKAQAEPKAAEADGTSEADAPAEPEPAKKKKPARKKPRAKKPEQPETTAAATDAPTPEDDQSQAQTAADTASETDGATQPDEKKSRPKRTRKPAPKKRAEAVGKPEEGDDTVASTSAGTSGDTSGSTSESTPQSTPEKKPAPAAKEPRKKTEPEPLPSVTLADLSDNQKAACERAGWESLMPVQEKAIPYLAAGRDIMVQARTGSGKTGGFVLPLLDILDPEERHCQALILVPTRELAQQVAREAAMLAGNDTIRVIAAYGGVGYKEQLDAFREGAQLVVGTPGRILDHLMRRTLTLDHLKVLVFDEADRMLSVGFYPDMKAIQRYLPGRMHGSYMFSATYPYTVLRLADEFLRDPEMLSLSADQVHVTDIDHQFCMVPAMGKERRLVRLIELENPSSAIIFCNTKRNVEFVAAVLQRFGYDAEELSSSLSQAKRESVLGRIREGRLRFLVATDVAARGIDIPELSHVFLYEPPEDPESYIHRAGRTGRAGASGTVISLVDVVQKAALQRIGSRYGIDLVERKEPEETDVIEVVEQRLTVLLEKKRRELDKIQEERVTRFYPLARKLAHDDETLVLLGMFLDELYQDSLHSVQQPLGEKKQDGRKGRGGRKSGGQKEGESRSQQDGRQDGRKEGPQDGQQSAEGGEARKKRKRRPRRRGRRGGGGSQNGQQSGE